MACALLLCSGCATEETLNFGDPARVSGGLVEGDTSGGCDDCNSCTVNTQCPVDWDNDVFPILSGANTGGCGNEGCHAPITQAGGLLFDPSSATDSYQEVVGYSLVGVGPYVTPCEPALSSLVCNLALATGTENQFVGDDQFFKGTCGSAMPKTNGSSTARELNQDELNIITTWITCGAPQNTETGE